VAGTTFHSFCKVSCKLSFRSLNQPANPYIVVSYMRSGADPGYQRGGFLAKIVMMGVGLGSAVTASVVLTVQLEPKRQVPEPRKSLLQREVRPNPDPPLEVVKLAVV
jgi:hypothetical protein